jgi:hypothetical protein
MDCVILTCVLRKDQLVVANLKGLQIINTLRFILCYNNLVVTAIIERMRATPHFKCHNWCVLRTVIISQAVASLATHAAITVFVWAEDVSLVNALLFANTWPIRPKELGALGSHEKSNSH